MDVVLAVDLGGSSLRAALVDVGGATLASHRLAMPEAIAVEGCSELDPEIWWNGLLASAQALSETAPAHFARVRAIAISAVTRSQVLLDRQGRVLRPAILWNDTRAGGTLPDLAALSPPDHPETAALNAFHPFARLWWLKQIEPDVFAAIDTVLEPKDFLHHRLTGIAAGDHVSMARLRAAALPDGKGKSLFGHAGIDTAILPRRSSPRAIMGHVRPDCAGAFRHLRGVPVIAMANDTWASVVGLGAMRAGSGYNLSGTTEVLGLCGEGHLAAEGLLTVDWGDGLTQLGGPSLAGGDTLIWLLDILGALKDENAQAGPALDALLAAPRAAAPLLFLPFLQGERVPFWDPDRRGAWIGLNRRHQPVDLAFSVLEGTAFLNRLVLERAQAALGKPVSALRFGGGGASSALWCQLKADILGCEIVVPAGDDHGVRGAAIVAFTALRHFASLEAGQDAFVTIARRYQPNLARKSHYDRLYALFREADAGLVLISHALAAMA